MTVKWSNGIRLKEYNRAVHQAIVTTAERRGQIMQNQARANAIWTDRTGNARGGLFAKVEDNGFGKDIRIHLAHTVYYGLFLEVSNAGRYAIIMPTIEANLGRLLADLKAILE